MATRPMIEPTERSMPPVMITQVMPSAMIAKGAKLRVTLPMFCGGEERGLVESDRHRKDEEREGHPERLAGEDLLPKGALGDAGDVGDLGVARAGGVKRHGSLP